MTADWEKSLEEVVFNEPAAPGGVTADLESGVFILASPYLFIGHLSGYRMLWLITLLWLIIDRHATLIVNFLVKDYG